MLKAFKDETKFVYLDPDIAVYSELKELDAEDVILTPHLLKLGHIEIEISVLQHGIFNLVFLGIKR